MDVEMTLSLSQRAIPDGALGDDERTETDRSPLEEVPPGGLLTQRAPQEERPQEDQDMDDEGDSPDGDSNGKNQAKKHHRRGRHKGGKRHRSWKPYAKLTWEERQKLDERETRRACKRREQRFASGHPLAPYNTTQFLMDQHPPVGGGQVRAGSEGGERPTVSDNKDQVSIDSYGSCSELESANGNESPNEGIFYDRDFSEAYETYQSERLQNMNKEELIHEVLNVEAKLEESEGKYKQLQREKQQNNNDILNEKENDSKGSTEIPNSVKNLQEMITKLKEENIRLKKENKELQRKTASERTTEEG